MTGRGSRRALAPVVGLVLVVGFLSPVRVEATPGPTTVIVDGQNSGSMFSPVLSGDGRYVAFDSSHPSLVTGDTNGAYDVFVVDTVTKAISRVSVASGGIEGDRGGRSPAISADGRYVAFESNSSNLARVDPTHPISRIYVHDRQTATTELVALGPPWIPFGGEGTATSARISADGRFVAFSNGNLGAHAVFVYDRETDSAELVSGGAPGNDNWAQGISGDGRYVLFTSTSTATGESGVYMYDRQTAATTRVSVASDGTAVLGAGASMSTDARHVAFTSAASNVVAGDTNAVEDIFVHDRQTGLTTLASGQTDGTQGSGDEASISGDGRFVVFARWNNGFYVHDRRTGATDLEGQSGVLGMTQAGLSFDGRFLAMGIGGNLYLHDRQSVALPTGGLRVTTSPPRPSQISVDGVARATWGTIAIELGAGAHEVCFADVEGSTTPPCATVEVVGGAVASVVGTFGARGFLRAQTSPALPAAILVDGVVRDRWGLYTDLAAGSHQVCFGAVADYAPPPCSNVELAPGATTELTGTYTLALGAPGPSGDSGILRVTTSPPLPSQLSVDGVPRTTWGTIGLPLDPGSHTVCFADVEGYSTPPCAAVEVVAGEVAEVEGTFVRRGVLQVVTSPPVPATIYVDGVARDAWGVFTDLPSGPHQVCLGPAPGYREPPCERLTLAPGTLATVTATFTPA